MVVDPGTRQMFYHDQIHSMMMVMQSCHAAVVYLYYCFDGGEEEDYRR
jgi:hypothetical protein